jgi:purine nucleosidase
MAPMHLFHLDTDLGGDLDDLCALAMLLHSADVRLSGITTVAENGGRRAGYARYVLAMEGQTEIPVAAGADNAEGFYPYELGLPDEARYWPEAVKPLVTPSDAAVELLKQSIEQGATIIGIGPYSNLALLERKYPGILSEANLVLMGGYIYPTRPGYPTWGNDFDFNIQIDVASARLVLEHSHPLLVPLTVTVETALRRAYLDALRAAGPLCQLIARQAVEFAIDEKNEERIGATCPALPADIINFQHDPLACAAALGWTEGLEIVELPLRISEEAGLLVERIDPSGRPMRVVTSVDGPRFNQFWLERVTAAAV